MNLEDLQDHISLDRVEIVNPGGLVGGLTLATFGTKSIVGARVKTFLVEQPHRQWKLKREYEEYWREQGSKSSSRP